MEKHCMDCSILIIGGGAAGIRAALAAKENGVSDILLVTKTKIAGGGATYYPRTEQGINGNSGGTNRIFLGEYHILHR